MDDHAQFGTIKIPLRGKYLNACHFISLIKFHYPLLYFFLSDFCDTRTFHRLNECTIRASKIAIRASLAFHHIVYDALIAPNEQNTAILRSIIGQDGINTDNLFHMVKSSSRQRQPSAFQNILTDNGYGAISTHGLTQALKFLAKEYRVNIKNNIFMHSVQWMRETLKVYYLRIDVNMDASVLKIRLANILEYLFVAVDEDEDDVLVEDLDEESAGAVAFIGEVMGIADHIGKGHFQYCIADEPNGRQHW